MFTDSEGTTAVWEFIALRDKLIDYLELFGELDGEVTKQEAETLIRQFSMIMVTYLLEDRAENKNESN